MLKCNNCKHQYGDNIPHYCSNCGNNLSRQIEKTDIVLFISNFLKVTGTIGLIFFTFPLTSCAITPLCLDGTCIGENYPIKLWIIILLPVLLIIISYIIRLHFKKMCMLNITNK